MIMGFAYSGTLKSHLMTPESVPPINSLAEIVQSTLRVKMAVYDDAFDQELAATSDSVRSKLWERHEPLQEFRGPVKINLISTIEKLFYIVCEIS